MPPATLAATLTTLLQPYPIPDSRSIWLMSLQQLYPVDSSTGLVHGSKTHDPKQRPKQNAIAAHEINSGKCPNAYVVYAMSTQSLNHSWCEEQAHTWRPACELVVHAPGIISKPAEQKYVCVSISFFWH